MARVLLLGSNGMLGHAIKREFEHAKIEFTSTDRNLKGSATYLDAKEPLKSTIFEEKFDYVINAIGVIKPHINEKNSESVRNAIQINSLFPHILSEFDSARVIQIATDCVFSGLKGNYVETDLHDPLDVYGKTKSLGEVKSENFMNIRCSIIGPELGKSTSLWEWVRNQPAGTEIKGFLDHKWNGVTTKAFGKIVLGILEKNLFSGGNFHLLPDDVVSKFELVSQIASHSNRQDIRISPINSGLAMDRTLATENIEFNNSLWKSAGYGQRPPKIEELIAEVNLL